MLDELGRLRTHEDLHHLLANYIAAGEPDRQAWQDRVMQLEGLQPQALVKLHGELLAYG
jgi:hypothetical protein